MHPTTRRSFAALIAAAAASALGIGAAAAQVVIQERVMPAPLVETIPVAPGPNYHWVPGHWVWQRPLGLEPRPLHRRRRSGHARGDRRNPAAVAGSRVVLGSRPLRLGARRMGVAPRALGSLNLSPSGVASPPRLIHFGPCRNARRCLAVASEPNAPAESPRRYCCSPDC